IKNMKKILFTLTVIMIVPYLNAQTITNFTTENGLPHNNVNCVAIDGNDAVWFGTQSGVAKYDPDDGPEGSWLYFTTSDGLVHNTIKCITVDHLGNIWAGTDYGISMYNGSVWTTYNTASGLGSNWVYHIAEDAAGNIWVGTMIGLSRYDTGGGWTNFGSADGLTSGVCFITFDSQGNKWLGTFMSGMAKFDDADFTFFTTNEGLLDDFNILSIAIDDQNNKWVATCHGISRFDGNDQWAADYLEGEGLFTEAVKDIDFDSEGNLWIGSYTDYLNEGAVNKYDGTNWEYFVVDQDDTIDSLVSIVIRRLAVDSQDNVWVATGNGASRISSGNVGISEQIRYNDLILFPNPASSVVNVFLPEINETGNIEIYDRSMKKIGEFAVNGADNISFPVRHYPEGLYLIRNGKSIKKLIIAH
ncbi:MAG: T9SS type A sorting domain-containing protein, partial [Bacteroidetes bacterium]|nr:T9SS type A sorting domain-containing protein [Bacteroidota bacterium]